MTGRDRLRDLLDAVLADDHRSLTDMAGGAYTSPFHFSRLLARDTGEPPVAMRRRVELERAAWRLASGSPVTEVAFAAGYESVDGFARAYARAFGHPPSATPAGAHHWLPAPNGIHFHAPHNLWVTGEPDGASPVTALMVHHDVDDVRSLLELAKGIPAAEYTRKRLPGLVLLRWAGEEPSIAALLSRCVGTYEIWLASIAGEDHPGGPGPDADPVTLLGRLDDVGPRWRATVRDIERRRAWNDRLVDALCDPPESFVLGSVLAHVLTYSAQRRGLVRALLRQAGAPVDDGDPIDWLQRT
ncbi:helix-turn-helix domain-containing protein [Pseudonocardia sp. 73-21]|uniref:helix-turn-helix domain-containing protein n=1 Tax=Pseudonocardia sp. 73-21 TaxID=1895809 RepID=UPI0009649DCE|nr:helix-turn-helix domain-containing protein [Pseudonocardia sp. 73-21]OJY40493.1 MAG: AraC family transcriptional regulator [Pseudonocardia sp. 73-21]